MKQLPIIAVSLSSLFAFGQNTEGKFIVDKRTGCKVWAAHSNHFEDSITWSGGCKNNMAEGYGTLVWHTKGKESARYEGMMQKGDANGKGKYTWGENRKLEGNFTNGEFLNLDETYLKKLEKNIIPINDTADYYVGDGNSKTLYYHALVPDGTKKGVIVLMCGTWETTEHLLSSNRELCQSAFDNGLAIIVPSVNQRLALTQTALAILNEAFKNAIEKYKLPKEKFVMGGWSMGGLFSVRYTEMALADSSKTAIVPKAVYSVDGPVDLEFAYKNFEKKAKREKFSGEAKYGLKEFDKYLGGSPDKFREKYIYYSNFSRSEKDGGNAKYLINTPIRIYDDVDPNWWMENRNVDMYDLNALDQTAMIVLLNDMGNRKAEFINAFGKGYRIEGNRHPHSWSIVDPQDCLNWIKKCLEK